MLEALSYTPRNWYWFVGSDRSQVYSSAGGDFVTGDDPAFLAWSADGTAPTIIMSAEDLGAVLAQYQLRPTAADVLDAYKGAHAAGIVSAVVFKVLFSHENRLRAIERALGLNGNPANLTAPQALAAVKSLM